MVGGLDEVGELEQLCRQPWRVEALIGLIWTHTYALGSGPARADFRGQSLT